MRIDTTARHDESLLSSLPTITDWVRDGWADIDVDQVARVANTAPHYFRRLFREATGDPILRFVRRMRLQVAAYRTVFMEMPLIDVAVGSGYGSAASFSRAFREEFGSCPAAARARRPERPWTVDGPCSKGLYEGAQDQERIAFVRHFGRLDSLPQATSRLDGWLVRHVPSAARGPRLLMCYDDPERHLGQAMRYDLGVVLDDSAPINGSIGLQLTPSGRTMCTRHVGPIDFIPLTYMHILVAAAMTERQFSRVVMPFVSRFDDATDLGTFQDAAEVRVLLA